MGTNSNELSAANERHDEFADVPTGEIVPLYDENLNRIEDEDGDE